MQSRIPFAMMVSALLLAAAPALAEEAGTSAACLDRGNARVVFVGDSITGQSRNHPAGFAHQIEWALKATYPDCHPNLISLGGSGAGVTAWLGTEKKSRTEEFFLDVKGVPVKASLDQPADVLVIMLGMNDVLAPYVADTEASLNQWTESYRALVAALRERLHPRVLALAEVTLDTEDPNSPKNLMIRKLNRRIFDLSTELGCRFLLTNGAVWNVLNQGRQLRPDFHVANDFVHPNEAGHLGVAIGMLEGLGEKAAAKRLADERLATVLRKAGGGGPSLSYDIWPRDPFYLDTKHTVRVRYWLAANDDKPAAPVRVRLSGPDWKVEPVEISGTQGEFMITGVADRRENVLVLEATLAKEVIRRDVKISPAWLVAAGLVQPFWTNLKLDPSKANTVQEDEAIKRDGSFLPAALDSGNRPFLHWQLYFPSVNYTGLDVPGSVDFAAVTHAQNFEAGYAARWIHADRARPVRLLLGTQTFAGALYLTVYLNGKEIYAGQLTDQPRKRKEVEAALVAGSNTLVVKANHCTWQWQFSADLAPLGDDSLNDLRYSTVPPR